MVPGLVTVLELKYVTSPNQLYCSFSSCIDPNAGNCSIGYSLPPRQFPWTENVPFWAKNKKYILVQGNWRGGRLYPILQFPALGSIQLLKLQYS